MKKYNIGIALSGGGVKAFAHLGVLQALNEKNIFPDVISGTSAGSIVGAMYAAGYAPLEIYDIFKKQNFLKMSKIQVPKNGFFKLEYLLKFLNNNIKVKNIEDLKLPLFICVTNFKTGSAVYLSKGILANAVVASSSIPILTSPIDIDNNTYVDGGLVDNLPLKPILRYCKKTIAVNLFSSQHSTKIDNIINIAIRSFEIGINRNLKYIKAKSDIYIELSELHKYHVLENHKNEEIFEIGYNYAKNIDVNDLRALH